MTQLDDKEEFEDGRQERKERTMRGDAARGSAVNGHGARGGERKKKGERERTRGNGQRGGGGGVSDDDGSSEHLSETSDVDEDDDFLQNGRQGRKRMKTGGTEKSLTPASKLMDSLSSYLEGASTAKETRAQGANEEGAAATTIKMKELEMQQKREEREHQLKVSQQEADNKNKEIQNRKDEALISLLSKIANKF